MSKQASLLLTILIAILFIIGFLYIKNTPNKYFDYSKSNSSDTLLVTPVPQQDTKKEVTVNLTKDGFSQSTINIKIGDTVTFINTDNTDHQINSANHPTHTLYPPINTIGLLKPAEKKNLIFPDKGSYKFHDHLNPQFSGIIIVE